MATRSGSRVFGASVTTVLVLGVVAVVSVPLFAGIVLAAFVPDLGALRSGGWPWRLLHLLWIYPTLFVFLELFVEPVATHVRVATSRAAGLVTEVGMAWVGLASMFAVFFAQPLGAGIAAALGLALLQPFTWLMQRGLDDGPQPGA